MGNDKQPHSPEKVNSRSKAKKPKLDSKDDSGADSSMAVDDERAPAPGAQPAGASAENAPLWFTSYMAYFEKRIEALVSSQIAELTARIEVQDEKVSSCNMLISDLKEKVEKLESEKDKLHLKLDDLENRARRNNLVFYGVPEKANTSTLSVMRDVLEDFVGLSARDLCIERCHRTPTTTTASPEDLDAKPRMVHIAFSSFLAKEKVRQSCIEKFKASKYKERKLFVSDDFSKKVMESRKGKMDALRELKSQGKKPFFLFPAKLAYRDASGKLHII